MLATAVDVLTRPGEFFANRPEPGLRRPALVVALSGLFHGLGGILLVLQFREIVPEDEPFLLAVGLVIPLVVAIGLLAWLLATGALYVLSYPVAGRGGGRELLAYVGWGWLPQALGTFGLAVAIALVITQLQAPTDEAAALEFGRQVEEAPLIAMANAAGAAQVTASGSFQQVQTAIKVGTALWSGYVWVAALRATRGLTRRQAALAVALPVLYMLFG